MALAFVFPGQGSQAVGMLEALARAHPVVADTFAAGSEVLGYDLWQLVGNGPEATLNATEQTQPAMLCAGVAVLRVWGERGGPQPDLAAGHSLGEFSALVCAESLSFDDALRLVQARARAMQNAVPIGEGGIAAILGLGDEAVTALCAQVRDARPGRGVWPVNFNAPGQVVIAGHADAVEALLDAAAAAGARRVIRLPMSVPVHCELMGPAAEAFSAALDGAVIRPPLIPVVHNADLASHDDPAAIRVALLEQLVRPVRWTDTVHALRARGMDTIVECGPGRVLAGLAKRIDRGLPAHPVFDPESLDRALEAVSA